jgi:anti-sigma B factor antagonist
LTSHYTTAGVAVIAAPTNFDIDTAPEVRDLTNRLLRGGATGIVIDLAAVTFIDSTALAGILATQQRLRSAGRRLAVSGATEPVTRMFRVTGLIRFVAMHATAEDAITEARWHGCQMLRKRGL